jgi:hypothetical protein
MHNTNKPSLSELPSTIQLLKSTVLAAVVAMILLLAIVMPSEYGIDPTGIGSATGLQRMGEIKMALAAEADAEQRALELALNAPAPNAAADREAAAPDPVEPEVTASAPESASPQAAAEPQNNIRSDEMQVTLIPGQGREIKVELAQGKTVDYRWQSSGGPANFDVHGDSAQLDIDYHSYSRGAEQSSSGTLEAAFDGYHGWFWRNRTDETLTVTLTTRGEYTDIKLLE